MEHKKYPIYSFTAKWSQHEPNHEKHKDYPKWREGLPEDRIWNSTSFKKMFKTEQSEEQLTDYINKWWDQYVDYKLKDKDVSDLTLTTNYVEHETWVLGWFTHETLDEGQSDEDALASFEDFVSRKEDNEDHVLMGAEDRWRWCGENQESPAPCRCKACKEQGLIRIGH